MSRGTSFSALPYYLKMSPRSFIQQSMDIWSSSTSSSRVRVVSSTKARKGVSQTTLNLGARLVPAIVPSIHSITGGAQTA